MQENDQPMSGQSLGPYRLESVLGRGGMGWAYLARQTYPARDVVVKVLQFQPGMGNHSTVLARFQQEANTAAMLEHIHIVSIFDSKLEPIPHLVMPYVNGGSLREVLQHQGKLPLDKALNYLRQVASALDYAHAKGVIHRDLKPSNFLLYRDGRLVLADFGVACVVKGNELSSDLTISTSNSIIGTPCYMAPETVRGRPIDTRADIYALGIVFFQMLSGHVPFEGSDPLSVLYKHVNEPLPSLHTADPTLPIGIDRILSKATAKRPEERYVFAGDMIKDLESVLPQTPYASGVATTSPPQQQDATSLHPQQHPPVANVSSGAALQSRRNRPWALIVWIITLIIIFVIAGLCVFVFLVQNPLTPTPSAIVSAKRAIIQYYDDINQRHYQDAYNPLSPNFQKRLSYSTFENGFSTTMHDDVTFNSVSQNSDGSVSVSTTISVHENMDSGMTDNTYQWNAKLIQINRRWRIESVQQWQTSSPSDLAKQVVIKYYDDINRRNYQEAYSLLSPDFQKRLSYSTFENGFSTTMHDDVTFNSVSQNDDSSVSVSTIINAHEDMTDNTYQWNAKLIQVNGAWKIDNAEQWQKQ